MLPNGDIGPGGTATLDVYDCGRGAFHLVAIGRDNTTADARARRHRRSRPPTSGRGRLGAVDPRRAPRSDAALHVLALVDLARRTLDDASAGMRRLSDVRRPAAAARARRRAASRSGSSSRSGKLGLGAGEALGVLVGRQQLERRVRLRADDVERALAGDRRVPARAARSARRRGRPSASSARSVGSSGKRAPLELGHGREPAREPDVVEVRRILRRDHEAAVRREDARRPRRARAGGRQVHGHAHHRGVEPAALERQRLGAGDAGVDAERLRARDHLGRGVDCPDARERPLLERVRRAGRCRSRSRATRAPRRSPSSTSRVEELPPVARRPGAARRSGRRSGRSRSGAGAVIGVGCDERQLLRPGSAARRGAPAPRRP